MPKTVIKAVKKTVAKKPIKVVVEEVVEVVEEVVEEVKKGKVCEPCNGTGLADANNLCAVCEGHGKA